MDDKEKGMYLIICVTPQGIAIRKKRVYTYQGALQAIMSKPTNRHGDKWVMYEITELKRIKKNWGANMNFFERREHYKSGQNPTPTQE